MLTCIWLLELDKTEKYIIGQAEILDKQSSSNLTLRIPAPPLTPNAWIILVEEMLPYFLFVSRWILLRGKVQRKQLAELLFAFIGIGGDIMEYFSLLGEEVVRPNRQLCYNVLSIWSLSVLQFTVSVTVTYQPKRRRNIKVVSPHMYNPCLAKRRQKFCYKVLAIFPTLLMQDLPYLVVRLYIMIVCNIIHYSLIFFTSKNVLIITLLFYKFSIICGSYYRSDGQRNDDDDKSDEEISDMRNRPNKYTEIRSEELISEVRVHLYSNPSYQFTPTNGSESQRHLKTSTSTNTSPTLFRSALNTTVDLEQSMQWVEKSQETDYFSERQASSLSTDPNRRSELFSVNPSVSLTSRTYPFSTKQNSASSPTAI